jgi:multiple sugar transport system ATP-binding protein
MPSVEVREVTKRFWKVVALKAVSFEVKDREFFTIVGPTNAGKTTTLRVVAGLEKPGEGEVLFDGRSMNQVPPNKRNVALMFQNLALYPHRNGFDNIAFPLRVQRTPSEEIGRRVGDVARFLRIEHLLDRLPGTYSGGERQRLAFARTMVRDPSVYMLDEPLANLDALIRLQMRGELKRIHQELGKTLIYVTHDQVEAMTMSDRIVVLNKGAVQQIGGPEEIYMRPLNRFVGGFFGSPPMNFVPLRVEQRGAHAHLAAPNWDMEASALVGRAKSVPDDRGIVFGIRPEDIKVAPPGGHEPGLPGTVVSLEQLGAKTVLDVSIGSALIRVSMPTTFDYRVQDRCFVRMNVRRGHLFDPQTEETLTRN